MTIRLSFLGSLLGATLAGAPATLWPVPVAAETYYAVTGVATDDVLNLRARPAQKASIVGALAPTTTEITVERRSGHWAYVRYGDKAGWVDVRYLKPSQSLPCDRMPVPLDCFGTEPFWTIKLGAGSLRFDGMEKKAFSGAIAPVQTSRNESQVWLVRPKAGPVARVIVRVARDCSDGMSEKIYPYAVAAEMRDGELLSGCCQLDR